MNCDDKSDFEVNKRLIELIFNGSENPRVSRAFPSASKSMSIHSTARVAFADESVTTINFCTCWGNMGPLIEDHKISLMEFGGSWEAEIEASAPIGVFGTDEICSITVVGKNPLRAAAICLIKKLEAENEK